jgi:hypothetical protein
MNILYRRESGCRYLANRWMYDVDGSVFVLQVHITRQLMVDHWTLPERTPPRHPRADSYTITGLFLSLSLSLCLYIQAGFSRNSVTNIHSIDITLRL